MEKNIFQKAIEKYKEEQEREKMEMLLSQCKEERNKLLEKIRKELFPKFLEKIKEEIKKDFVDFLKSFEIDDKNIEFENGKIRALNGLIELSIKQSEHPRHILEIEIKVDNKKFRIISTLKGLEPEGKSDINKSDLEICEEEKRELQIIFKQPSVVYVLELENKHPPAVRNNNFYEILKVISKQT